MRKFAAGFFSAVVAFLVVAYGVWSSGLYPATFPVGGEAPEEKILPQTFEEAEKFCDALTDARMAGYSPVQRCKGAFDLVREQCKGVEVLPGGKMREVTAR